MTASVSRPATIASTASRCPGRSSEKPNTSRATRSMAGGTAWGMCKRRSLWEVAANIGGQFPSGLARVPNWCKANRRGRVTAGRAAHRARPTGTSHPEISRRRGMFERIRARRFQREREREDFDRGGVATAERDDPRDTDGNGTVRDGNGTTTATRVRDRDTVATRRGTTAAGTVPAERARDEFGGINWGAA